MTTQKELSPQRCHQLREGGILRLLVNLLHEHTLELQNKPEADFNIELFLMDFNRKAELRARMSQQIRTIVGHTAKNEDELSILKMLEALRMCIAKFYFIIDHWKAITEDPSKLSKCTALLTELADKAKILIEYSETFTANNTIRRIFEQFGGVFVIVDYLRAQTRFNTKCHQFKSDVIDISQFLGVVNDSKHVLRQAVVILRNLVTATDSSKDIRLFLGNSRSLHSIMVGIAEDAYDASDLQFVRDYCYLLVRLYHNEDLTVPIGVIPSTSHLNDCGVIKCLAKFGMNIKDPETHYHVLQALEAPLGFDRQIALEFVSIDGAVDMLIDVLVPSKEKDEDVENAGLYETAIRPYLITALVLINQHLMTQNRIDGRLLAIYESRDLAGILVRHLEQITSVNEYSLTTGGALLLLGDILVSSEDQRRKFPEMVNGKEVVKRFESSDDEQLARLSKQIGEMFE